MGLHVPSQIGLMHPIDGYHQYMINLASIGVVFIVPGYRWKRQQNTGSQAAESDSRRPVFHLYLVSYERVSCDSSPPWPLGVANPERRQASWRRKQTRRRKTTSRM